MLSINNIKLNVFQRFDFLSLLSQFLRILIKRGLKPFSRILRIDLILEIFMNEAFDKDINKQMLDDCPMSTVF